MKAMYKVPVSEVMKVEAILLSQTLSGPGFNDGGKDDGSQSAQSPRRPF